MIHAYDDDCMPVIREKVACMFEIAVIHKKMDIDDFANKFISSNISKALETNDFINSMGKSGIELLSIILNEEPENIIQNPFPTPEYWVGYVISFVQWYFNKSFKEVIQAYPCSKLINNYFPYHEMDIMEIVELYKEKLNIISKLKIYREKNNLSQGELANLSGIPIRTIRAYEQGKLDIAKAQAETIYKLAKVLNCTIEELII